MPLPINFDENEWFIMIIILASMFIFLLPRRFPKIITILMLLLCIAIPKMLDHTLARPPIDLYHINDTPKMDLFDLISYLTFPPFGYLFLYFYDKWQMKGTKTVFYIIGWSIFAVFVEWFAVQIHMYTYTGWRLYYSFPSYLLIQSIYLYVFFKLSNYYRRE